MTAEGVMGFDGSERIDRRSVVLLRSGWHRAALVLLLVGTAAACGMAWPWRAHPPAEAVLRDTWVRPVDGMPMLYVPAGEFLMGLDEQDLGYVLDVCAQFNPG
jgi:hypothetical protein